MHPCINPSGASISVLIIRNGVAKGVPAQSFFFYDKRFAGFVEQSFVRFMPIPKHIQDVPPGE
jgi:hypothetical protein